MPSPDRFCAAQTATGSGSPLLRTGGSVEAMHLADENQNKIASSIQCLP